MSVGHWGQLILHYLILVCAYDEYCITKVSLNPSKKKTHTWLWGWRGYSCPCPRCWRRDMWNHRRCVWWLPAAPGYGRSGSLPRSRCGAVPDPGTTVVSPPIVSGTVYCIHDYSSDEPCVSQMNHDIHGRTSINQQINQSTRISKDYQYT